jgi:hypothetical protein
MKTTFLRLIRGIIFPVLLIFHTPLCGQNATDLLENGFKNPPESAKPRTWWHWTNRNITLEGITKDLEWMKRAGIGGMQLADVASGQGQTVKDKIIFGSPEWLGAVKHAASEAGRLNLEMTIFSSAGWSLTGGPWVKPEEAMKKLVWSETRADGPATFSKKLPMPPSVEGPVGNMSRSARITGKEPQFYRDFSVLAFPTPKMEKEKDDSRPVITINSESTPSDPLFDNDLNTSMIIRSSRTSGKAVIKFAFDKPFKAQAITVAGRNGIPFGTLKVSNDGENFETVALLPGPQLYRAGKVETVSFPEKSAKIYILEFTGAPWRPADVMSETRPRPDSVYNISEITLHSGGRINRWEDKAGFFHLFDYESIPTPETGTGSTIDPSAIIDLTSKMDGEGNLKWPVPEGNWTIMRFGYSLTGSKNRPAVPEGLGYEVDKLSKEHTLSYIKQYTGPVAKELGSLYGTGLSHLLLDSWEAGMQNWTDNMIEEFRTRRGYDLKPYLPALAGRIVSGPEFSDRVLWDFRRTLADMFAENHFRTITDYMNKDGISTYGEVSGVSLEILEDALLCKKYVDIPMGEFWFSALHPELMYYQDIRGAASASHIYGKKITAAESFTGGGFESPWSLKKIGDYWFAQGVNRIIFHTSAHQPLDTKPGNTMVGTHINRNITWAELAAPFMTYLSRNSYMLQQGRFVADLVYLLKEGAPSTMPVWDSGLDPALPEGFDYDYINADALVNNMSVDNNGRLILPDGMSYAVLVLPNSDKMTLHVVRKIHNLVEAGATVTGRRPTGMPGLSADPGSEMKFRELVDDLWRDLDGISRTRNYFGKGMVTWGTPLNEVLVMKGVLKDLEYTSPLDTDISWIHRRTDDADIYFVVNRSDSILDMNTRFRVTGREAEIWDPVTGIILPAGYRIEKDRTVVPLQLSERQSVFIVFRKPASSQARKVSGNHFVVIDTLRGPWEINFPTGSGAPEKAVFNKLESWTLNVVDGIKYFSGTATYIKTFEVTKGWLKEGAKLLIDLGKVADIAEISVNGVPAGILWSPPFRTDITGMLRKGMNTIEIKVTNQWTNRLLGDQKAGSGGKVLNSPLFVSPRMGLKESGLIGPVTILKKTGVV